MAEDEANADDPEDDINAYMTWFPRYVCSDVVRLVGSGWVRLSQVESGRVSLGTDSTWSNPLYYYLQENHGFGWLSKGLSLWIRSRGFGCWSSWFQGCQISKKTKNVFWNSYVLQAVCYYYYQYYFQIYLSTYYILKKFQRATHSKS